MLYQPIIWGRHNKLLHSLWWFSKVSLLSIQSPKISQEMVEPFILIIVCAPVLNWSTSNITQAGWEVWNQL